MNVDLHIVWFMLLGVLMTGYAILDGFDLGVGILHVVAARTDMDRRMFMQSIGPIWDGNEVWLVTFGGALFAAFPNVYAAAFSGFYLAFMLLLIALIFRAVSLEFRSKKDSKIWRSFWDYSFCLSSTLSTFIFGLAVGGTLSGVPIDGEMIFRGGLRDIVQPYPLVIGLFAVATCAMHGAIYLNLKFEGELQERMHVWMWRTFGLFIVTYMLATIMTLIMVPWATKNFQHYPISWIVVVLNVLAIANIPRAIYKNRPLYAFVSSSCSIAAFTFLFGVALFPNLLVSTLNTQWSLTVYNGASSELTLFIMAIIAAIGMPFVMAYTGVIYWVFRGKVKSTELMY